jgi:hypothetical protein
MGEAGVGYALRRAGGVPRPGDEGPAAAVGGHVAIDLEGGPVVARGNDPVFAIANRETILGDLPAGGAEHFWTTAGGGPLRTFSLDALLTLGTALITASQGQVTGAGGIAEALLVRNTQIGYSGLTDIGFADTLAAELGGGAVVMGDTLDTLAMGGAMVFALDLAVDIKHALNAVLFGQVANLAFTGQRGEARQVAGVVGPALVTVVAVAIDRTLDAHPRQAHRKILGALAVVGARGPGDTRMVDTDLIIAAIGMDVTIDTETVFAVADPRLAIHSTE